jgi:TPR repeat protein
MKLSSPKLLLLLAFVGILAHSRSLIAHQTSSVGNQAKDRYKEGLTLFENLQNEAALGKGFAKFQEAANEGYADAINAVGLAKIFGLGTQMDINGGRDDIVLASKAGSLKARFNTASFIVNRVIFKDDIKGALTNMEVAASKGDVNAQFRLGTYLLDLGIQYDPDRAIGWFEKASAGGLEDASAFKAGLNATKMVKNADEKTGLAQLQHLSAAGNKTSKYWLGEYFSQLDSDHADPALGLDYFLEADELGVQQLPYEKGRHLINRLVKEDARKDQTAKVITFLENQQTNSCLANCFLGAIYLIEGSKHQDFEKGKLILEKGARRGCEMSAINLGDLYRVGRGVTNDLAKASDYYTLVKGKTGEGLYKAAAIILGAATDKTTPEQMNVAYQAAIEAAKQGNRQAPGLLARILARGGVEARDEPLKAYAWALAAVDIDPQFGKAEISRFEKNLTEDQKSLGVKVSQLYKIMILKSALQRGEAPIRF